MVTFLALAAAWVPGKAWLERHNAEQFNAQVGWANILALSVGALGLILVFVDRRKTSQSSSGWRLREILDDLAVEILSREGSQLAYLLGTNEVDSRSAVINFTTKASPKGARARSAKKGNSTNIAEFFLKHSGGRLVILGSAGSGKTVLALTLLVDLLQERLSARSASGEIDSDSVPVYFNVTTWRANRNLVEWLADELSERYRLPKGISEQLLRHRLIIPILDGLDELDSENESERMRLAIGMINEHIAKSPGARIVVACRSGDRYYDRLSRSIRSAVEIVISPLVSAQVVEYICLQCPSESDQEAWLPVFDRLRGPGSRAVQELLCNPWRMTTAVTFYLNGGDPRDLLPMDHGTFGGKAQSESRLDYLRRTENLLYSSFVEAKILLYEKRRYSAKTAERLVRAVASLMTNGRHPTSEIVLHRFSDLIDSEKFARAYGFLFWLVMHIPFSVYGAAHNLGLNFNDNRTWSWLEIAIFVSNFVLLVMLSVRRGAIAERFPLRIQLSALRSRRASFTALGGTVVAVFLGIWGVSTTANRWYGITMGILIAFISIQIALSSASDEGDNLGPRDPLRYDAAYTLMSAVLIGFFYGIYVGEMIGVTGGTLLGGLAFVGWLYSSSSARYIVAIYVAHVYYRTPLRLGRFLEWARYSGLVRTSGLGYEFRHAHLQQFLATAPDVRHLIDGGGVSEPVRGVDATGRTSIRERRR